MELRILPSTRLKALQLGVSISAYPERGFKSAMARRNRLSFYEVGLSNVGPHLI
jgi:hypothetical protein